MGLPFPAFSSVERTQAQPPTVLYQGMARSVPLHSSDSTDGAAALAGPAARISLDLYLAAACRLVSQKTPDIEDAGKRLLGVSAKHGIDFSLVWVTAEPAGVRQVQKKVRQACLAVIGAGKTAMIYVSEPPPHGDAGGPDVARIERAACIRAACAYFATRPSRSVPTAKPVHAPAPDVRIAQALPDPSDAASTQAFRDAGFIDAGTLYYLRTAAHLHLTPHPELGLLPGERLASFAQLTSEVGSEAAQAMFARAMDASYEDTLDCPELCGLRATQDVLESHRSIGKFDPRLWWVVLAGSEPSACLLLSPCEDQKLIELVYIGVAKPARGRRLGSRLLAMGLAQACVPRPQWEVACAVDERNIPARRLYEQQGFEAFEKRCAMVFPISPPA